MNQENMPADVGLEKREGFYVVADRWVRKGDWLALENVEGEDGVVRPRIAVRFYGFSPSGHPVDDENCPDNVAPIMAHLFVTMSNDGFEAVKHHLRPKHGIHLVNPATIIRPGE
ncbi:MAG TPA: hypothetical protein VFX29_00850 [Longimicrobiaceae bacterium]|nr:hypothetical protein [Longimicrobiaceae bacterium]